MTTELLSSSMNEDCAFWHCNVCGAGTEVLAIQLTIYYCQPNSVEYQYRVCVRCTSSLTFETTVWQNLLDETQYFAARQDYLTFSHWDLKLKKEVPCPCSVRPE